MPAPAHPAARDTHPAAAATATKAATATATTAPIAP